MTARDIQRRLIFERYRVNFVLHNYTPSGWFECDLFQVTAAGYFVEYEIKISRADFKADAAKAKRERQWQGGRMEETAGKTKHALIAERRPPGPSRFFYVMPSGLYSPTETPIPDWAGLITIRPEEGNQTLHPYYMHTTTEKDAPQLHREKLDEKILEHARGVCYWRLHNLIVKNKFAK